MTPLHSCTQLEGAYGMETMIMLIWKLKHTIWSCTSLIFAHCSCMQELNDWNILIYLAYFYTACLCCSSGVFDVTGYDDDFNKFAIMFRLKYLHRRCWNSIKALSHFQWNQAERNEIWHIAFLLPEYQQKSMITNWLNLSGNVYLWIL